MNASEKKIIVKSSRAHTSRSKIALLVAATALAASTQSNLRANTVTSTWVGGTSINWSNAANWSPNSADPNNGNNGVSDYNVIINSVTVPNLAPTLDVTVTIDNLTLNTAATLALNSANTLNVNGSTLANSGNITILGNASFGVSLLNFNNNATLSGGGAILLTDSTFSKIGGANLTNLNNTIQGAGHVTSNITNQGTIIAQGGTLTFDQNITNTTGTLSVAANGTLSIGGTLTGSLNAAAGAQILGSGILSNVTLNTASALTVLSATVTPTLAGTFTNKGTITLLGNGTLGTATLTLDANGTTLNGNGTIILTDGTYSRISGGNLTNINDTIRGAGHFTSNIINQGTIIAEGGVLTFDQNANNTAGTINIAANGTLFIGGTLTGSITAAAGSQIAGSGILSNVTLNTTSALSILSGAVSPTLLGTFTNKGTITLLGNGTLGSATLSLDVNGTTLNGGGTIFLTDGTFSRITGGNLTNVNNTIRGAGHLASNVFNRGTIIAESGILTFDQSIDNTIGTLSVAANGTLSLGGTLTGSITAAAGSQITGSGTLLNVTLNTASAWSVLSGAASPTLVGTFTNKGNVTLQGNGTFGGAFLTIGSNGTILNGGGTIFLTDSTYSRISGGNLTNIDNTIRGAGHLASNIFNHGAIIAEGGTLTFDATSDNTAGSISVAANATLSVSGTLTGGTVTFAPGSQLAGGGIISSATISGTLAVSSGLFSNVTLNNASNLSILPGSLQISGTFTNNGIVTLLGNGTLGSAMLTIDANGTTLTGGGTVVLTDSIYSRISGGNLTNINNTIRGAGHLASNVTNHGAIIAEGGTVTFDSDVNSTGGTIGVAANSTLSINATLTGGIISSVASSQIVGSGTLSNVTLNTGSAWNILAGAASPTVANTFTNKGTVTVLGNGTFGTSTLVLAPAGETLNGGGTVALTDATYSRITAGNLTNIDNSIQGNGTISLNGGTFNNSGTYNFSGTLNSSDNITNSGNFTQSGPQNWSANTTFTNSGNATFTTDTGSGSLLNLTNTAGLLQLSTPQNIHNLSITGGNVTLPTSANPRQNTGVVLKTSNLSIASSSILDITNHDLILGNSNLTTINTEILNGFGAGPGGAQITSSTATGGAPTFLIPLDAAAFGISSWDNVPVTDPNTIIIKYTTFGDATLDGLVNSDDFGVVISNLGTTTAGIDNIEQSWTHGDVNLDGLVNADDFGVIISNLGSAPLAGNPGNTSPSNVPEPESLALLAFPAVPLLRRRKKS